MPAMARAGCSASSSALNGATPGRRPSRSWAWTSSTGALYPSGSAADCRPPTSPSRAPTVRQAIDRARPAVRGVWPLLAAGRGQPLRSSTRAAALLARFGCGQDDCRDVFWPRLHRHVARRQRGGGGVDLLRHRLFERRLDHSILLRDDVPGGLVLPGGVGHLLPEGLAENR